jgi:hypothetical protein
MFGWFRSNKQERKAELIPVSPKNYRSIVLHAIATVADPKVYMDGCLITDLSERGPLTQRRLKKCIDFVVRNGGQDVLGFHDHPREMWITIDYGEIAEFCEKEGWLKIEGTAS